MRKILILSLLVCFTFGCAKEKLSNDLPFDSVVWKETDKRTRGRMSPDLIERKLLIGKSKDEVEEVLGRRDHQFEEFYYYHIDIDAGWDYELKIMFDKDSGKVISVGIGD